MIMNVVLKVLLIGQLVSCNKDVQGMIADQTKSRNAPLPVPYANRYGYNQQYPSPPEDSKYGSGESLIEIQPVNAFVAGLTKLFAAFLTLLGAEVTIVGKREVTEDDQQRNNPSGNWQYALISEALLMGSIGDSAGCLQRASCEAPTAAKLFSTSFDAMHLLAQTHLLSVESDGKYDITAEVLRNSSAIGIAAHVPCHKIYPCKYWSKLKAAALTENSQT